MSAAVLLPWAFSQHFQERVCTGIHGTGVLAPVLQLPAAVKAQ